MLENEKQVMIENREAELALAEEKSTKLLERIQELGNSEQLDSLQKQFDQVKDDLEDKEDQIEYLKIDLKVQKEKAVGLR